MSETPLENPFKINGIELIHFSLNPHSAEVNSKETFEFSIELDQKTNADKRLVIIFSSVDVKDPENKSVLANLRVACGFEIISFENIIRRNKNGDYLIPHDISVMANRISIATTRGILFNQLRGTYLQKSILPVLPFEIS